MQYFLKTIEYEKWIRVGLWHVIFADNFIEYTALNNDNKASLYIAYVDWPLVSVK